MNVADLVAALERIAPTRLAEPWDNVGLLVGDPTAAVRRVLLCVDYTHAVAAEGERAGCDAVVAYHPPIFKPLKRLIAGDVMYDAVRRGVAVYSPHTALDVAEGGTNDMLADALGLIDRRPLRPAAAKEGPYRLVVSVAHDAALAVGRAAGGAGAGRVEGHAAYRFHGAAGGEGGAAEGFEDEGDVRVEMVVPATKLDAVVTAVRAAHPDGDPSLGLTRLASPPEGRGLGRVGALAPISRPDLVGRIKRALGLGQVLVSGPTSGEVTRAACGAGACGDLLDDVLRAGAGLYLTGELRHHDALRAERAGVTVVCTLHSNSERAVLDRVADSLSLALPGLETRQSAEDRDPFTVR